MTLAFHVPILSSFLLVMQVILCTKKSGEMTFLNTFLFSPFWAEDKPHSYQGTNKYIHICRGDGNSTICVHYWMCIYAFVMHLFWLINKIYHTIPSAHYYLKWVVMQLGRHIHRTMNLSRQISSCTPYKYVYNDRGILFHEKNWTANILCFFHKLMARG